TRPAYGLCSKSPATMPIVSAMNTTADMVVRNTPAIATGWRTSAARLVTTPPRWSGSPLLQTLHVGHHRVDVGRPQTRVLRGHRGFLGGLRLRRRILGMGNPLTDVVGAQLSSDAVERARLSTFARDRVTHLTLLRGVDVLSLLDQRGILPCRRGCCATQREHN